MARQVVLCRLSQTSGDANPCEIIEVIRDGDVRSPPGFNHKASTLTLWPQDEASSCCCTWTKDPATGSPYICVGGVDAKVKIYDVSDASLVEVHCKADRAESRPR